MPSPNPPYDHYLSPEPTTPRKTSADSKDDSYATTTPTKRSPSPGPTGARARPTPKKTEPTLLTDFLLGRPSPARVAAERRRRQSLEAVKAELREEMKASAVRKLQPPGGVKNRVQAWQRANAAVGTEMPDDAATEPSDVAWRDEDVESVNEDDRIRIKMRLKKRNVPPRTRPPPALHPSETRSSNNSGSTGEGDRDGSHSRSRSPPKKRVVSDDHWVKPRARKAPIRRVSPRSRKSRSPNRIPADFVQRPSSNASVPDKVKAWADKVQGPDADERPSRSYRSSKSQDRSTWYGSTASDMHSDTADTSSQVTARRSAKLRSKSVADDGIRVTPMRKKAQDDDGIRVTPMSSTVTAPDDGIRVRPISAKAPAKTDTQRRASSTGRQRSKTMSVAERAKFLSAKADASDISSVVSRKSAKSEGRASDRTEVTEDPDSVLDTPTKRPGIRIRITTKARPKTAISDITKPSDESSFLSDDNSYLSGTYKQSSDLSSSIAGKSIADIPGDIPFGHSAFSELDLPLNGPPRSRPKKIKVDRTTSLRGMPNVFKKVVEEGKKIIQDMNEPPRQPVMNKPPSIEKWLNNTVDPFVDAPAKKAPATKEPDAPSSVSPVKGASPSRKPEAAAEEESVVEKKTQRRLSTGAKSLPKPKAKEDVEEASIITEEEKSVPATESPKEPKSSTPAGLKRSRATRSPSSPMKPNARRQFLGALKDAFKGESTGHTKPIIKSYQSQEERKVYEDYSLQESVAPSEVASSYLTDGIYSSITDTSSDHVGAAPSKMPGFRLPPPTNGDHELSTIMSEGSASASASGIDSDMTSDISNSTLTQSTALTKDSDNSQLERKGSGLKRRLTKHSDLVSVLSLPDDSEVLKRIPSRRSRPSQRRARGKSEDTSADDLLKEFAEDENLYLRELKTLVDGVVPVLLSQVIHGNNSADLFGPVASQKADSLSKSVVNMGVALEKLNNAHKKAPISDLRKLAHWAHGVVPIYHHYLKAWRLGFQDLIVNLAPRDGVPDDEDSLLDALPRNEHGDVINANGERVAVAYLLKRPLIRVKQMAKFIKCIDLMMPSSDTNDLLRDFEELQEKARRRHREETARMTDEEAINTDTTRARDPRTLKAAESAAIDPARQVSAKDIFSLNLAHSNGQRLDCQVELVHRDNQSWPDDEGDLLVRETGDGGKAYLLFPPIAISHLSARTGDGNFDMVLMLRGTHYGKSWHELITLSADNEDQILDWLDILPLSPVPPREPEASVVGHIDNEPVSPRRSDIPVGAQTLLTDAHISAIVGPESPMTLDTVARSPLPSRYRPREAPTTPKAASPRGREDRDKTPTQDDYVSRGRRSFGEPLVQDTPPALRLEDLHLEKLQLEELQPEELQPELAPEPLKVRKSRKSPNTTRFRDDGAPPPPIHRTLEPSPPPGDKSQSLTPPVELKKSARIKRRTSSPLKHEYLPSDVSSASETYSTESDSEPESESGSDSSDDEIDSLDIPETELGVSIKKQAPEAPAPAPVVPPPADALLPDSDLSLTPSNSASQAGLHGHKTLPDDNAVRYMSSISRWSEKGQWKDLFSTPCSIIITAGLIEAYAFRTTSDASYDERPLLALDLTPLVLIRQSTALDLEIRSSVQPHCRLHGSHSGGNFRFRCHSAPECFSLYMAVHQSRLNNQKFIQLENEARFRSFGEQQRIDNDDDKSSKRRSWFGRKNSYRGSVRAPAQSQDGASSTPSSSPSASSFLKRLTASGNVSFNIAHSSLDKQGFRGASGGGNSLYTSGSSSASGTPPRSPSVSVESSGHAPASLGAENLRIRLHLLVTSSKWEDFGNCSLQIRRPPPGWRQALRADHGLEKRITVTTMPRKDTEPVRIVLDAVLGSGCFSPMGSRGIVCGVWEEVKDSNGVVGMVPQTGATGGNIKKWCFQCATAAEASWVLRLVHQEVLRA